MNIMKILSIGSAGLLAYDFAKKEGFLPMSLMSVSSSTSDLLKEMEYTNWRNSLNNPSSSFYTVQNVGDGVMTVGWGLTNAKNSLFDSDSKITHYGQKFSFAQLDKMYKAVVNRNTAMLKDRFSGLSIPQGVFDAVFSAYFNAENGLFFSNGNPTNFFKHLANGDFENARLNFDFWKSGGQVLKGLVIRRMQEHAIWIGKTPKSREYYSQYWEQFRDTKSVELL